MNKERAWNVLERLAFVRVCGTEDELKAAKLLQEECKKAGVEAAIEPFEISNPIIHEVKLEMTSPEVKEFYCTGQGKSGETPDEGVEGPLVYMHLGTDEELVNAKGAIILSTKGMNCDLRKKCIAAGAIGYIVTWGGLYDDDIMKTQVPHRDARLALSEDDNFPGVMVHLSTAEEILKARPEKMRIVLKQDKTHMAESRNVVATIEGTDPCLKDEVVVFSAHMDSVEFSKGAWDNGTGSICVLELLHYFKEHAPKRTVKFVWCGSEEVGLKGSWAFCQQHKDELKNIIININFDMLGTYFGRALAITSCDDCVLNRVKWLAQEKGLGLTARSGLMSSDSTSFALNDVPAMSFGYGAMGIKAAEIHSRRDTMERLDPNRFEEIVSFIEVFSENIINCAVNPVPHKIPDTLKKDYPMQLRYHGWGD